MNPADDAIADLAQAVLDGEAVSWADAEATPARGLVRHLKVVAAVARVHREDHLDLADDPSYPHETWSHLRIVERIGRGANGTVFRAWDTRLEREVALKLLPAEEPASGAAARLREGRLLARVRHPNVVTIYGADQIDGRLGMWMELVRGRTLEDLLRSGQPFEPSEVARIGLELARALQAVHEAGLLHRDVKAQNVVRDGDGRIVLMDFGTGRGLDDQESDLTGTPLYLAPEIFRGEPATVQTDIYGLGVLLFHLLTGSFPVNGASIGELRRAHARNARTDLQTLRPELPRALVRGIERAIDPVPKARYPAADAMAADLEAAARQPRRTWAWLGLAAVMALLLAPFVWISPERPTIAVLPAQSAGGTIDDVLADGFTIDLVGRLRQLDGVTVRSATSSLAYKGRRRDAAAFGRDLGVTHVLEATLFGDAGSIRRVTTSLVRLADVRTVWSSSFDAKNASVFAVRERVALGAAGALGVRFAQGRRNHQTEPKLQLLFYSAQALRERRDTESRTLGAFLFDEISRVDPSFVPALAGLARALLTVSGDRDEEPPLDPRAEPLAIAAHAQDPMWPEANAAMGLLCAHKHQWDCARQYFERAIDLDPGMTTTHADFVLTTLLPLGLHDEALRLLEAARIQDPMSLDVKRSLAHLQVENGLYDLAIRTSQEVMAEDADLRFVEQWIGRSLYLSNRPEEAFAYFPRPGQWGYRAYILATIGRHEEARALLAENPRVDMRHVLVYAGLNERDNAFGALERAAVLDPWRAVTWMQRPEMSLLRDDPRYETIRQRLLERRH